MTITYTFPADAAIAELRGVTCTGGRFTRQVRDGVAIDVCAFETRVGGKQVMARVAGRPELEAALAQERAAVKAAEDARRAVLEAAVPGLSAYEAAAEIYSRAAAAYDRAAERGYPVREAQAAKVAEEKMQAVFVAFPATKLWRQILAFQQASHDIKASAGDAALAAVLAGVDIAVAVEQMQADWSAAARRAVDNS